jgi:hypothetical protein
VLSRRNPPREPIPSSLTPRERHFWVAKYLADAYHPKLARWHKSSIRPIRSAARPAPNGSASAEDAQDGVEGFKVYRLSTPYDPNGSRPGSRSLTALETGILCCG